MPTRSRVCVYLSVCAFALSTIPASCATTIPLYVVSYQHTQAIAEPCLVTICVLSFYMVVRLAQMRMLDTIDECLKHPTAAIQVCVFHVHHCRRYASICTAERVNTGKSNSVFAVCILTNLPFSYSSPMRVTCVTTQEAATCAVRAFLRQYFQYDGAKVDTKKRVVVKYVDLLLKADVRSSSMECWECCCHHCTVTVVISQDAGSWILDPVVVDDIPFPATVIATFRCH
jgi:hypothetical protein